MQNTSHEEMFKLKSQSLVFAVLIVLLSYPTDVNYFLHAPDVYTSYPYPNSLTLDPLFSGVKFKFREYNSYLNFDSQASFTRAEINDANINFTDLNLVRSTFGIETDMNVTITSFFESELKLVLDVYGSGTSTINIYELSDLGEPTDVQGASFVYSGGVLTLSSPVTDFQEITIWWYPNWIDQYLPLMMLVLGFVTFLLPIFIIAWRRPSPADIIKLLMVSFIGFALLMGMVNM